jgi:hypothetical protein
MVEGPAAVQETEHKRPPNFCYYCNDGTPWDDPRAFGVHLERHREVLKPVMVGGRVTSTACPNGCGRHFLRPSTYREHVPLCDGSKPLWTSPEEAKAAPAPAPPVSAEKKPEVPKAPYKEEPVATPDKKKECGKCGRSFKYPSWALAHEKKCDGKKTEPAKKPSTTPKPTKEKKPSPAAARAPSMSTNGKIVDVLRDKAKALRAEASAIVEKAVQIEKLAADLERIL